MAEYRADNRNRRRRSRGHGCLGFGITLVGIVAVFFVLVFTTNWFIGPRNKILGIFYPTKFTAEVEQSAKEFGVDKNLIYAVIKNESGFREDVESHAGAVGLMQLMPDTFDWLQQDLDGAGTYTADDLKTPAVNIRYGTFLLKFLLDHYDGNTSTALAAYNAGVANVDSWLEDRSLSPDGKTLTDIPYKETKNYVEKVGHSYEMYQKIYGG